MRSACAMRSPCGIVGKGLNRPRNRNTDVPNNRERPSDASRNAKVSTPASVMGTSAKDLAVNEYESSRSASATA